MKKIIFNLNITTEENNIRKIIIETNNNKFEFNSNDESYDEIDKFIDYLLKNIEKYDQLDFKIDDNLTDINRDLANEFIKIWINDYKQIKNELNNFYNNIEDMQSNSNNIFDKIDSDKNDKQ